MLYINEIQHLESFCTRDSCLENSTKCVIFLPLDGLKRHVWPLFRCFFLYFAHLLAVLNFSIPTLLGRSFVAKWQVSLQKKGVTGSNPWVGKPSYGEVSRLASEQKSSGEGLRRPLWQIREGVVVRSWGCCGAVMRVLWCGHEGVVVRSRGCHEPSTTICWMMDWYVWQLSFVPTAILLHFLYLSFSYFYHNSDVEWSPNPSNRVPSPGWGRACCYWRKAAGTVLNSFDKKSKKVLWDSIILKLKSCGRKYAKFESFLKHWKRSTCIFFTFLTLAKWFILHFKTAHFTFQNESFCRAKWAILRCKKSHFENGWDFSSFFVRFFYQNKSFRFHRMKKKVGSFFGKKCL